MYRGEGGISRGGGRLRYLLGDLSRGVSISVLEWSSTGELPDMTSGVTIKGRVRSILQRQTGLKFIDPLKSYLNHFSSIFIFLICKVEMFMFTLVCP